MAVTRRHEPGSDDLNLDGGSLCLTIELGQSVFLDTGSGPVQVQVIRSREDGGTCLRIVGKALAVRSSVLQRVLTSGEQIAETTERGRAIKSFMDSLVAAFRAKQKGGE